MKKLITTLCATFILIAGLHLMESTTALAQFQPPTLLPSTDDSIGGGDDACIGLATMIRTGDIHLRNIPCFIKYITQTIISLAGSLAVIFIMIGGYRWTIGSDQDKETAKKTITYAIVGLVVALLAWVIVDLVLQVSTE